MAQLLEKQIYVSLYLLISCASVNNGSYQAGNYLFKVEDKNTRPLC